MPLGTRQSTSKINLRLLPEVVLTLLVFGGLTFTLASFDAFEKLYDVSRAYEDYELDEVIAALMALPAILLVFSIRRLRDLKREIGRRKSAESDLHHQSRTDALTGLPNRHFMFKTLQARLDENETLDRAQSFALLHIGLDRFKHINDRLGPIVGDHFLRYVSHFLDEQIDDNWTLARVGGDEFLLLADLRSEEASAALAEDLVTSLNRTLYYDSQECSIAASIGVAFYKGQSAGSRPNAESLLINADIALHRAKSNGRNCFEIFRPEFKTDFEKRTALSNELLQAFARKEFFAVYQPLVEATSHRIVGAEALVRWQHPTRGTLNPSDFMEEAQTLGVVAQIDQLMFEDAVKRRKAWEKSLDNPPRVAVNVSADRLKSEDFLESVKNAGIEPNTVSFEISEAVTFEALDDVSRYNLDALSELGIEIEIDDFGSGRASILSLLEMRPSRLKIDRNLTAPITTSEESRKLIASILDIARSLDIEVVGEGVETGDHAELLSLQGCAVLQGYHFSRPLPAAEFEELLASNHGLVRDRQTPPGTRKLQVVR